jgi:hypothetical protein
MLQDLYISQDGYKAYVEGHYLLHLVEARVEKAPGAALNGTGTRADPFVLDGNTPAQWLWLIAHQNQAPNQTYFMNWNGRRVGINGRLYVFDDGKAGSTVPKDPWNEGVPPSYREIAKQLVQSKLNETKNSQKLSQKIRAQFANAEPGDVASYGGMLPTLAGAMFLAEPRRNLRAWPINWMLVDFSENLTPYGSKLDKHFTWDNILWHPEALAHDSHAQNPAVTGRVLVKKPQTGPNAVGVVGPITNVGGLHRVGGKMPASPTGGGAGGGAAVGGVLNYIQQKEVSILVRWLAQRNLGWTTLRAGYVPNPGIPVLGFNMMNAYAHGTGASKNVITKIQKDIDERITTFQGML